MDWSNIDWGIVVLRGVSVIGIWLLLGVVRHYSIRSLPMLDRRIESFQVNEQDLKFLNLLITFIVLTIGLVATISILKLTSLLLAGQVLGRIIALATVWILVWVSVRHLSQWVASLDERIEEITIDPRDLKTIDRLVDYLLILVGIIISLAILNITSLLYSALTAAGVISVIIGLAVKDIAANFISGVFLLIDRPFAVGDTIKIKEYLGTVNKISLRSTEIITLDGPLVSIPNNTMAVEPTTNYSLSSDRRVLFTISVLNTANLSQVINTIQTVLDAEKRLLSDKPPSILVGEIRHYAVDFQIVAYTSNKDLLETQSDLQQEIVNAFMQHGIELAVPLRMNINSAITAFSNSQNSQSTDS